MKTNTHIPSFLIREATIDDAEDIFELMSSVQNGLRDKSLYIISDIPRIRNKLSTDCYGYLVYCNNLPIAFHLFQKPDRNDKENNLGFHIGLSEYQRSKVLILDSVAVLEPFRRLGISTFTLKLGIYCAKCNNVEWIMTTVDPRNEANLRCLIKQGFGIMKEINAYMSADDAYVLHLTPSNGKRSASIGYKRYILAKRMYDSCCKDE